MTDNWIEFKEVVKKSGLIRNTAKRRIDKLRERQPRLCEAIMMKMGNKTLYHDPSIFHYLEFDPRYLEREKSTKEILDELFPDGRYTDQAQMIENLYYLPTEVINGTKTYISKADPDYEKHDKDKVDIEPFDWEEVYKLSEGDLKAYKGLKTIKERHNFKKALKIMQTYLYTSLSIEKVCKITGTTARTFQRWVNKMSYLSELYQEIKIERKKDKEEAIEELMEYELNIIASGYNVTLPTLHFDIIQDMFGNLHRVPTRLIVTTKHVPKNVRASIFWLRNHFPEKWPR